MAIGATIIGLKESFASGFLEGPQMNKTLLDRIQNKIGLMRIKPNKLQKYLYRVRKGFKFRVDVALIIFVLCCVALMLNIVRAE